MGCSPQSSNAELVALVATQALLGLSSEARRRLRYAHRHLATMFPHLPQQSGTTTKRAHPPRPPNRLRPRNIGLTRLGALAADGVQEPAEIPLRPVLHGLQTLNTVDGDAGEVNLQAGRRDAEDRSRVHTTHASRVLGSLPVRNSAIAPCRPLAGPTRRSVPGRGRAPSGIASDMGSCLQVDSAFPVACPSAAWGVHVSGRPVRRAFGGER